MKMLLLLPLCMIILFGCGLLSSSDNTETFIPGTYIRYSSHEVGKEFDTLVISLQNESAHEFKVIRKWRYERVMDGKDMQPEYQRQTSTAIYHSDDKVMQDTKSGGLYSFDVRGRVLFNGDIKYKKL